jgi:hypothetical protein
MAGDDFVMVQLSAIGIAAAKGGPLSVSNGRRHFLFTAGVAQRVERSYEWNAVLARSFTPSGEKLFELAPAVVARVVPVPVAVEETH